MDFMVDAIAGLDLIGINIMEFLKTPLGTTYSLMSDTVRQKWSLDICF